MTPDESQSESAAPRRFAPAGDTSRQFEGQIADVLRQRLRIIPVIGLAASLVFMVIVLANPEGVTLYQGALGYLLHGSMIAGFTVLSAVLWFWPSLSLRALRRLELAVILIPAAFFSWQSYAWFAEGGLGRTAVPGQEAMTGLFAGSTFAMRWAMVLVCYGIFIPNTGRRSARVVGILAPVPLLCVAAAAFRDEPLRENLPTVLAAMAAQIGVVAFAASYGSHRISALSAEAFQAKRLGQYRLLRRLGGGGMGEVFLAEHQLLRRPCAVKIIRPQAAGDPAVLARFEREVRATSALTHPNTVEVYDFGRADDGTFYYVMEHLSGLSLAQLSARHGPQPPARVVHVLRQVCGALAEAHRQGLVHRDIKPGNIMLCERGGLYDVAKLLDFGLVATLTASPEAAHITQAGAIVGTPAYMSPEQATGGEALDARTDLYSLGAVAYLLLSGRILFPGKSSVQIMISHIRDPVVPLRELRPDVPADLEAVVLRCLAKSPADRFADAFSLESALAACESAGKWTQADAADWRRAHTRPTEALDIIEPSEPPG